MTGGGNTAAVPHTRWQPACCLCTHCDGAGLTCPFGSSAVVQALLMTTLLTTLLLAAWLCAGQGQQLPGACPGHAAEEHVMRLAAGMGQAARHSFVCTAQPFDWRGAGGPTRAVGSYGGSEWQRQRSVVSIPGIDSSGR